MPNKSPKLEINRRKLLGAGAAAAGTLLLAPSVLAGKRANIAALKPCQFIWRPDLSPVGPVVVIVSLPYTPVTCRDIRHRTVVFDCR